MKLKLFIKWPGVGESILEYPGCPNVITRVLISEKGGSKGETFEDAMMLPLKVEES